MRPPLVPLAAWILLAASTELAASRAVPDAGVGSLARAAHLRVSRRRRGADFAEIRHEQSDGGAAAGSVGAEQPKAADFFTEDAEQLTATRAQYAAGSRCHSKCRWHCERMFCDNVCKPVCQPPKCVTACAKPNLAHCRHVCRDPVCTTVCPKEAQCPERDCPKCTTLCGEPQCVLDCGQARACESRCQDPVCSWNCTHAKCPEPHCILQCDKIRSPCGSETQHLNLHDVYNGRGNADGRSAAYADGRVGWQGFGRLAPANNGLRKMEAPRGALPPGVAKPEQEPEPAADEAKKEEGEEVAVAEEAVEAVEAAPAEEGF